VQLLVQRDHEVQHVHRIEVQLLAEADIGLEAIQVCLRRDPTGTTLMVGFGDLRGL